MQNRMTKCYIYICQNDLSHRKIKIGMRNELKLLDKFKSVIMKALLLYLYDVISETFSSEESFKFSLVELKMA